MSMTNPLSSKSNIRIRSAVPADYDSVIHVLTRAWEQFAVSHPGIEEALRQALLTYLEEGSQERFVAEADGLIVGTGELFHSFEEAYGIVNDAIATPILRRLAVLPEWQGKGIASRLVHESARRASASGSAFLFLHTSSESNAPAVRLYTHLGFTRATDQDFYSDEHFMEGYRLDLNGLEEEA
ncbi:GNAT family N-acetyltransferase [Paenibacillus sp. NPDC058071]|uniref:GNAT family N-acetyltransferase n=1 Tax=Paenibacillus sp. NPDC058071 TaxID=3346326 RepID=UPI0036DB7151